MRVVFLLLLLLLPLPLSVHAEDLGELSANPFNPASGQEETGSGLAIEHCPVRKMGGSLFSPGCLPLLAQVAHPLHHSAEVDR